MNPAGQKNVQSPKRLLSYSLLIILILSALLLVSASLVAAALVRESYGHRMTTASLPSPDNRKAEKELAQGRFLVADQRLMDPNFRETVVLLIRYGPEGTMGLVINRPLQVKLSIVFPDVKELDESKETLYLGGPVEPSGMLLLVKSAKPPEDSMPVFGDVYLSSSQKMLQRLIKTPDQGDRFRIFAGYAGWAPKQLEYEHAREDWHVLEADAETLFDRKPSEIWPELIQRVSANWVRLKNPGTEAPPTLGFDFTPEQWSFHFDVEWNRGMMDQWGIGYRKGRAFMRLIGRQQEDTDGNAYAGHFLRARQPDECIIQK